MSQMVTRQGPVGEDIDKRQTASPVKEMKKKMAANAEKEKIASEKHVDKQKDKHDDKADKKDKKEAEKHADKAEKKEKIDKSHDKKDKSLDKSVDKKDKSADKSIDKKEKSDKSEKKEKTTEKKDKSSDKKDKNIDKQVDKSTEKKETAVERAVEQIEEGTSAEKTAKQPKDEDKQKSDTMKHNGEASRQNGKASNGTASESDDGEEELVIVEADNDEMFPELAYDDTSDTEPTDTDLRSVTRRSQAKVTRTPETPRPASVKQADKETDDSKEMKLLKLKEDILITDRRLRSANSPKPSDKRSLDKDSPKKEIKKSEETKSLEESGSEDKQENIHKSEGTVTEMVIEVENIEGVAGGAGGETRRDTRYSRSRVKVSPYRRSARLADNTATSILANYTGNNTTMEMDITESFADAEAAACDTSAPEDSYLAALRTIRARRSYRDLKPLSLTHSFNTSQHSLATINARESNARPTGTVVGRKRRPEAGEGMGESEGAAEAGGAVGAGAGEGAKRPRLLERLTRPFRTTSTPLPARRAAEIVGINTDLPQSAPVAADDAFDPETIKPTPTATLAHAQTTPLVLPTPTMTSERDSKRCVVM
ncbi:PREDICTED: zinc finger CCCH domain-containing protein 13-like isoform X1 [Papilio xuthus]|uniref:Zinc finger CCCH domain-containing protein 13-like isoform X1 n=1 Tax=Papilio xuthus TaxID=66420 RepID=A0AAJ7E766_PAPXU|nr:PREDICTED: zinc finger CCCH domain-containing protein 13-like isoform X1 [Papilio xuthus]